MNVSSTRPGCAGRTRAGKERCSMMKRTTWAALGAAAFLGVVIALLAGKDDIRRFRRMHDM